MAGNLVGNLAVNLTMNTAAFQKGATLAEKRAEGMRAKMAGIGKTLGTLTAGLAAGAVAGAVAGLTSIASAAFEMGSNLTEAASKVGVTVEALQEMRYVAEQNGISVETMDGSLNKMTKTLGELQLGTKANVAAFAQLGLSARDMRGLSADQSLIKILEALGKVKDETVRAALGNKVFGRSYAELKPLVDLGAEGIRNAVEEKRRDGVLSTEQASKLDELADGWERLKGRVVTATASFIANQAGAGDASMGLDNIGKSIGRAVKYVDSWIDAFLSLQNTVNTVLATIDRGIAITGRNFAAMRGDMAGVMRMQGEVFKADREIGNLRAKAANPTGAVRGGSHSGRLSIKGGAGGSLAGSMAALANVDVGAALDRAGKHAEKAGARIKKPISDAAKKAADAVKKMAEDIENIMDRLFPEKAAERKFAQDSEFLKKILKLGKISQDQFEQATQRLGKEFVGDLPQITEDSGIELPDGFVKKLPEFEGFTKSIESLNVRIVKSFKDMADDTLSSISNLANAIKGGGVVGILEGILGLFTQLGSIGVFGKSLQTRINSPIDGARASGGPVRRGGTYLVGEKGPELFTAGHGGYITANDNMGSNSRISIVPSPYFDAVVDNRAANVAAPMAGRAAMAGSQIAQQQIGKKRRNRIP